MHHRTSRIVLLGCLVLLWAGCSTRHAQPDTTVVLVRHAEKQLDAGRDPALSPAGVARAEALADVLADTSIDHLLTTPFKRTNSTAEPLAERLGLTPTVIDTAGSTDEHVQAVAAAVRARRGTTLLVVGHSNTIPRIIAALGGPARPDLEHDAYSDLFILLLADGQPARLIHSRYGAASAAETSNPRD